MEAQFVHEALKSVMAFGVATLLTIYVIWREIRNN